MVNENEKIIKKISSSWITQAIRNIEIAKETRNGKSIKDFISTDAFQKLELATQYLKYVNGELGAK